MMPVFPERHRRRDAHRLAERVAADFHHAQAVDLADAAAGRVDEDEVLLDHLANFRFEQIVPVDFRVQRQAHVPGVTTLLPSCRAT